MTNQNNELFNAPKIKAGHFLWKTGFSPLFAWVSEEYPELESDSLHSDDSLCLSDENFESKIVAFYHPISFDGFLDKCEYIDSVGGSYMNKDSFPDEFFNHQLMELDISNDDKLCEFVSRWGIPEAPTPTPVLADEFGEEMYKALNEAKKKTAKVQKEFSHLLTENKDGEFLSGIEPHSLISIDEVRISLRYFQESILSLRRHLTNQGKFKSSYIQLTKIDHRVFNSEAISYRDFEHVGFSLTGAISNQIADTICSPIPWRVCCCDGCETIFKIQQTDRKRTRTRSGDVLYCCTRHADRQKKRNLRKKK